LDLVRNRVGSHRLEHRDMKNRVDCTHAVWKPKSVRPGASSGNHFKRAKIFLGKLLRRPSGVEELRFDKRMRTNRELGSWISPSITRDLVLRLSEFDLLFQLDMQLVKVNSKVTSSRGSEVSFRVDSDVRVVSFVHEERQDTCGSVRGIVVGEFGERQQLGPVVLLIVAIDSEVLFQGLVDMFGLSITFGVIS